MRKYLFLISIIWSCTNNSPTEKTDDNRADIQHNANRPVVNDSAILGLLNTADSVIIASHYTTNAPVKDEKTGKYLLDFDVVEDGKLNQSIIQEHKVLDQEAIKELGDILTAPATEDDAPSLCFQPRNGVFVYKSGEISYIDVCFDCFGASIVGNWNSAIIFDSPKYQKLMEFYKKHGFKYML